ncbi:MAG: hypothetical protein RLZZ387_1164 [Chloroflexota bacterium]|jgi:SAM-dependent methyltransferase
MSAAACPLCNAPARPLWEVAGHQVYDCGACGMRFVDPVPTAEALARHYAETYAVPLERYGRLRERHTGIIADVERWQPGRGRLLEVGASYGHQLQIARDRGWEVQGVELSPRSSAHARDVLDVPVHTGDLLGAPLAPGSFDAALMIHVLEHTRDPRRQVERLRELLRPGGVLGLRVPNARSLGARLAGRHWMWMCPPTHLWFFDIHTLPRLLRQCGLEVLEARAQRGDGLNPYQHALMALGWRLGELRRRISSSPESGREGRGTRAASASQTSRTPSVPPPARPLAGAWAALLRRALPVTDALDRTTAPLTGPLERAAGGDELVCYARRPTGDRL